jgi:hypothetical protein
LGIAASVDDGWLTGPRSAILKIPTIDDLMPEKRPKNVLILAMKPNTTFAQINAHAPRWMLPHNVSTGPASNVLFAGSVYAGE